MQEDKPTTVTDWARELSRAQDEQQRAGISGLWTSTSREPTQDLSDRKLVARLQGEVVRTRYATAIAKSPSWRRTILWQLSQRFHRGRDTIKKDVAGIVPSTPKCGDKT